MAAGLTTPTDFAKLTASSAATLASLFNNGKPTDWNIFEAAYISNMTLAGLNPRNAAKNKARFHIFISASDFGAGLDQVTDQGGRRVVEYRYPYKDGQTTEDLGRTPFTFQFNVILHGDNYLIAFQELQTELNLPSPGILTHPIYGDIQCKFKEYNITHKHDTRKAMTLSLTFVEHNFDAVLPDSLVEDKSVQSKLTKLLDTFKNLDALATKVEATIFAARTIKNTIKAAIANYQSFFAGLASSGNLTFNPNPENYPSLVPVNQGGNLNGDGTFAGVTAPSVRSVSDPFNSVPVSLLSTTVQQAIATDAMKRNLQTLWNQGRDLINQLMSVGGGVGALEFYDDIQNMRQSLVDMQKMVEAGIQSSRSRLLTYTTPRVMSIREVAFANGLSPDKSIDIDLLNPELLSVNLIPKGTTLRVAV
jgi:hypothetical protein